MEVSVRRAVAMFASVLPCAGVVPGIVVGGETSTNPAIENGAGTRALGALCVRIHRYAAVDRREYHDGMA